MEHQITPSPVETQADNWPVPKDEHYRLACWHLYEYLKPLGAPTWDELTSAQRNSIRFAFRIGCASVRDARWLRGGE
jgi:hypothetical protein